jgi:hypothetical protein
MVGSIRPGVGVVVGSSTSTCDGGAASCVPPETAAAVAGFNAAMIRALD